jgi:2-polyprenyl-3-methyl-5-hydroxy-6-metoxy-1,4-benzoquinol methylase
VQLLANLDLLQKRSSLLVRLFGFPATLIHGDTLVLDRWLWMRRHLPKVASPSCQLLDVGCGSGAFTIAAARKGYDALGLSWDENNQSTARHRAELCLAASARFEVQDVRRLDSRTDLRERFGVVICCENIEHILNDQKLIIDIARCLLPGGMLLLTTPNVAYRPMTKADEGPFVPIEDGGHVRKGYSEMDLHRLCRTADLQVQEVAYCSGIVSQKLTGFMRIAMAAHPLLGWSAVLPFRFLPLLLDKPLSFLLKWPGFSITLVATKPQEPTR